MHQSGVAALTLVFIDGVLYDALRICLRPTPIDSLPILSGIQPAELRRLEVTLSLVNSANLGPTINLSVVSVTIDPKMPQEGKNFGHDGVN